MAGTKRAWDGNLVKHDSTMTDAAPHDESPSDTPIQSLFKNFRGELDEHHDRRERVIKASRDITALSKKVIFSLQRVRTLNSPIPKPIAKENDERFAQIRNLFKTVADEISSGPNPWRYHYQYNPGLQEYIEALSFQRYIERQRLITHEEVIRTLPDQIVVSESDYVLGLFDLTGEMMRFGVTTISARGITPGAKSNASAVDTTDGAGDDESATTTTDENPLTQGEGIVRDLRALRAMFERLNVPRQHGLSKEVQMKIDTMQASVEKVEWATYGLLVRGSERPTGWVPDLSSAAPVESF